MARSWGLEKSYMEGIRNSEKTCNPSSPYSWSPPLTQVFKFNFDGASRGNPGPASFGGACKDSNGRILVMYMGAIGTDTNNSAELEGLIRGFKCMIDGGWSPAIIEGDSNTRIQMAKRLTNRQMAVLL